MNQHARTPRVNVLTHGLFHRANGEAIRLIQRETRSKAEKKLHSGQCLSRRLAGWLAGPGAPPPKSVWPTLERVQMETVFLVAEKGLESSSPSLWSSFVVCAEAYSAAQSE